MIVCDCCAFTAAPTLLNSDFYSGAFTHGRAQVIRADCAARVWDRRAVPVKRLAIEQGLPLMDGATLQCG